jgi:small subunit ribosomal protein S17
MAHDRTGECKMGDRVVIEEYRPLSRRKRWQVKEVIQE